MQQDPQNLGKRSPQSHCDLTAPAYLDLHGILPKTIRMEARYYVEEENLLERISEIEDRFKP